MSTVLVALLSVGVAIIVGIIGVAAWVAITLFKNELNLKITSNPKDPKDKSNVG